MSKVTLDMATFKALASDTRLDILKVLDGKKMALKDISKATKLNKATLHEHLSKLNEAGLVKKKEREGHKWVYYKLTWKGECLLHPDNTRIVVLFTATFFTLFAGIINLVNYVKGQVVGRAINFVTPGSTELYSFRSNSHNLIVEMNKGLEGGGSLPPSYTQAPVATISQVNQTPEQLSHIIVENVDPKGVFGNSIPPGNIEWTSAAEGCTRGMDVAYGPISNGVSDGVSTLGSETPPSLVGVAHDPFLQYIAIACIVIFSILVCFSVWKLLKSRKQKL